MSARSPSSIKVAERPMEPHAFKTSFYKNKGIQQKKKKKKKNPSKSVFVSWLYYGTSEMKDGNNFSHLYDGKQETKQFSIKPGYTERRNFSVQFGSSSCDQHTLSKLSHRIF